MDATKSYYGWTDTKCLPEAPKFPTPDWKESTYTYSCKKSFFLFKLKFTSILNFFEFKSK